MTRLTRFFSNHALIPSLSCLYISCTSSS